MASSVVFAGMDSSSSRSRRGRLPFVITAVGTLPYLTLKLHWLSGGDAGVSPDFDMHSLNLTIANLVTLVLDGVVIVVAWTLTARIRTATVRFVAPLVWGATGLMATPVLTYLVVIMTKGLPRVWLTPDL